MAAGRDKSSLARMPFIVSSNVEKADAATRKLIRSHVMRGKKAKRDRSDADQRMASGATSTAGRMQASRIKLEEVIEILTTPRVLPIRIGSDFSFFDFADDIEPTMLLNMHKRS